MKYDGYHQKLMFKVICITIKLVKHWKTSKYEEMHFDKSWSQKNAQKKVHSILCEFSTYFEFDMQKKM